MSKEGLAKQIIVCAWKVFSFASYVHSSVMGSSPQHIVYQFKSKELFYSIHWCNLLNNS